MVPGAVECAAATTLGLQSWDSQYSFWVGTHGTRSTSAGQGIGSMHGTYVANRFATLK